MKLTWSRRALLDIEHIHDYIAHDNPAYAQPFIERLLYTTRHLPQFPHSGRAMPEANNLDIREIIYQGYRVIYRIQADTIQIVTVIHGSRNVSQLSSLDT
jgi:toxin ParE1/3/4